MDVALITCSEWPRLSPSDACLQKALLSRGIDAQPLVWNDSSVDWSRPLVSIIRSTWDYHLQYTAFLEWATHVSQVSTLWNPLSIVKWNTHKSYLCDLSKHGVPIIPTVWLAKGSSTNLAQLMQERDWSEVIIKPAVSAEAYGTILVKEDMAVEYQLYIDHMTSIHDMLIQPFLPAVVSSGERSLMFVDGEVTHAVVRPPIHAVTKANDSAGKVQAEEGPIALREDEVQLAYKIMKALPSPVLYGRVDLVDDAAGELCVMEVELVEPGLWLQWAPAVTERFADAVVKKVEQAREASRSGVTP